jgi:hypothetical protein
MELIKMIVTSFSVASNKEIVTKKLTIVIHPDDIKFINLYKLEEFLASA